MEEFLLRPLLSGDELNIIDQQEIDRPVACTEVGRVVVADRIDELVGETLRREIGDHHAGEQAATLVTARVEQVRLAEADTAIDEQRVIGARRELRHRLTGGLGELVRGSDDERVERVARIQPFPRAAGGGVEHSRTPGRPGCWRRCGGLVQHGGRGIIDNDRHPRVATHAFLRRALQGREVVLHEPVTREPIRGADAQMVGLDGKETAKTADLTWPESDSSRRAHISSRTG